MNILQKSFANSCVCLLFACFIFLGACSSEQDGQGVGGALQIVATTGMIADATQNIVGNQAQVTAIMGPGVDPHLYKATREDLTNLRKADIVLYNGLHLEGKMGEVLEKFARQKNVVAVAESIPPSQLRTINQEGTAYDPHVWFDVNLWTQVVERISEVLQSADQENAPVYEENTEKYLKKLRDLHQEVQTKIRSIPKAQRVLITAHDAFGYFGQAYDIEVKGLQGISTLSEFGLRDVKNLVEFIVERKIKSVFVETSIPRKSLEAVIRGCQDRGHNVKIGGTLFSDAMGASGSPEGSYLGMVTYNVESIVQGLQ